MSNETVSATPQPGFFKRWFNPALLLLLTVVFCLPGVAFASGGGEAHPQDFTSHWIGFVCVAIFVIAYALVIGEETIHLRKSKPVMVAAGIIWALVAVAYTQVGDNHTAGIMVRHNLLEFGELFLFLLAAMTTSIQWRSAVFLMCCVSGWSAVASL